MVSAMDHPGLLFYRAAGSDGGGGFPSETAAAGEAGDDDSAGGSFIGSTGGPAPSSEGATAVASVGSEAGGLSGSETGLGGGCGGLSARAHKRPSPNSTTYPSRMSQCKSATTAVCSGVGWSAATGAGVRLLVDYVKNPYS